MDAALNPPDDLIDGPPPDLIDAPPPVSATALQQSFNRIQDAFTLGEKKGYGDGPIFSPETEEFLKRNDYRKDLPLTDLFKGVLRGGFAGMAWAERAANSVITSYAYGLGQVGEELGLRVGGQSLDIPGAVQDPSTMMITGPAGEFSALTNMVNARRAANLSVDTYAARASGILAEGEAGHFEAVPLTPEHAQARVSAAREAGIPTPAPVEAAADVHALARRIDPPAFDKFDALETERNLHRATVEDLSAELENSTAAIEAKNALNERLDKLRASGWNLTEKSGQQITELQERLASEIEGSPAMARARQAYIDATIAQQRLLPDVESAYRQARDMMPEKAADVAKAVGDVSAGKVGAPKPPTETVALEAVAQPAIIGFKTAKGSTYEIGEGGVTTRNKAARADAGHEGDSGLKQTSARTIYVDPKDASNLSGAGLEDVGGKGFRLIIKDGKATLASWNKAAGKWGVSPGSRDIPFTEVPEVGKAPVEAWKPATDMPNAYRGQHAGNPITELTTEAPLTAERVEPPKQPTRTTTNLRAIEGTGEEKPLTLASKIEARAIEDKFVESFPDLPTYKVGEHDPQFEKVAETIASDYEHAKDIAMGNAQPPRGVHPEAFLVGVERHARAIGDVETIRELGTTSRLTTAAKTMGQRIRLLGERDQGSPVAAIQAVQEARLAALEAKNANAIKNAVKEIKATVKRSAPKRDAWVQFIADLTCKV